MFHKSLNIYQTETRQQQGHRKKAQNDCQELQQYRKQRFPTFYHTYSSYHGSMHTLFP